MSRYRIYRERTGKAERHALSVSAVWIITFLLVVGFIAVIPYLIELAWDLSTPLIRLL